MKGLPLNLIAAALAFFMALPALAQEDPFPPPDPPVEMETVNINRADAATLAAMLNGIGMSKAQAIIAFREEYGDFQTVDELLLVQGIGEFTLENNRERIVLEE